jgi:hypothetical protein
MIPTSLVLTLWVSGVAHADPVGTLRYTQQGRLFDASGAPFEGPRSLVVTLYDGQTTTTTSWRQTFANTPFSLGYFSVTLSGLDGEGRPLDAVGAADLWMGFEVDGVVVGPRQPVSMVPVAARTHGAALVDASAPCTVVGGVGFDAGTSELVVCVGSSWRPVVLRDTISCSVPNSATALRTWTGTEYGACTATSCVPTYHIESGACASDTRACTVSHGTGTQTWTGSAYGLCVANACESGYHVESGACVQTCPGGTQLFTYTGGAQTFTTPFGCTQLVVDVYGGGGGGSTHVPNHGSWGGGGGGFARSLLTTTSGAQYAVTVGHGGAAAFDGSSGGASSFGGLLSASAGSFINGGSGSGGNQLNRTGGSGNRWIDFGPGGGGGGAAGPNGNGGGGGQGGPGGSGGGGYAGAGGGSNGGGGNYGGGGGGGSYGSGGGSGAPGLVVVTYSKTP